MGLNSLIELVSSQVRARVPLSIFPCARSLGASVQGQGWVRLKWLCESRSSALICPPLAFFLLGEATVLFIVLRTFTLSHRLICGLLL